MRYVTLKTLLLLISHQQHWKGGWASPGALSVSPVHGPIPTGSPANPLGSAATTAPMALTSNALLPLVYWYGHPEIKRNPLLMDRLIRNLGENVNDRFELDPEGMLQIPWDLQSFTLIDEKFIRSIIWNHSGHTFIVCFRTFDERTPPEIDQGLCGCFQKFVSVFVEHNSRLTDSC